MDDWMIQMTVNYKLCPYKQGALEQEPKWECWNKDGPIYCNKKDCPIKRKGDD